MASPLIAALRARYPTAHLAWLVQPEAAALLQANTALDEVIVWPRGEWRRLLRGGRWWSLLREAMSFIGGLRKERFDLALDLQGLMKSGVWARLSGARERVGLGSKEGSRVFMTRVIDKPEGETRIGAEYRHLAEVLGLAAEPYEMHVALSEADRDFARRFIEKHSLGAGYAVICPFTTRPQKHWLDASWAALAGRLQDELGLKVVMLGGPGDRTAADAITRSAKFVLDATGRTTLREAAALIERARLLVGVDTGLMHMGTAFGTPTIALFGSTCPYRVTDSDKTVVLYKALPCSPCHRSPTCGGAYTCMREIVPEEVLAIARQLLVRA
ncbi:lipopolysaccharide heptosyltransferase [Sulfurifustis variabilis]|uniref:Lipopolysaccharide heptosyltransferase n=1 Tax=Sulfurifustis variabilis TaxID=1675686 RepID=A0A1B4V9T6_9GAMM|nr:glycosyltransferase family 9 protein [Sulfurifustis variabilis]BAU50339.1 lipopolysaccharide heptosyltransferase [Sulfurifustis variabilis]